jgi:hypothetical protein
VLRMLRIAGCLSASDKESSGSGTAPCAVRSVRFMDSGVNKPAPCRLNRLMTADRYKHPSAVTTYVI